MSDTKKCKILNGNTYLFTGERPIKCPHCDAFVEPSTMGHQRVEYESSKYLYIVTFKGECCSKLFFACYLNPTTGENANNAELLLIYPSQKPVPLSEQINEISPRFVELYNQCYTAEKNNHFELAGSGYRNALEVLVKDYAIKELSKDESEVKKKSLYEAISLYLPSIKIQNSADVIRVLGNDYTHYERKYTEIDFNVLKAYLDIFIKAIEMEYLMSHPVVDINR